MAHAVQPFKRPASSNTSKNPEYDDDARPYVIVGDIGKGSFATVYKGYHEETRYQVAIKAVKRDSLTTKLFENLQSEIQILKSLSHRHITKLIDIVRAEKHIYLIMEFCAGGDLTNYIKKRGRVEGLEYIPAPGKAPQYYPHPRTGGLDEIAVRSFLRQLARALKFLRHRNLIHRDIKPQNLLLNPASPEELARGHPLGVPILKVADFGFARSLPNAMMAETLCGSPLYMAPEILRYEKYDAKADLWSVGAVLFEMAVGKAPFRAQNHIELLKKIEGSKGIKFPDEDAHGTPTHPNKSGGGGSADLPVPEDIKSLIRTLLKRNPAERASFEEFFGSLALARSKFPRPQESVSVSGSGGGLGSSSGAGGSGGAGAGGLGQGREREEEPAVPWNHGRPPTPEHHKIIPPEVLDPTAMIPPSKFNFRRVDGYGNPSPRPNGNLNQLPRDGDRHYSSDGKSTTTVQVDAYPHPTRTRQYAYSNHAPSPTTLQAQAYTHGHPQPQPSPQPQPHSPSQAHAQGSPAPAGRTKRLSTEGSFIPGETEEDGNLRREYVLVGDTRAVEFGRAVDEISLQPRKPLHDRRNTPASGNGSNGNNTNGNSYNYNNDTQDQPQYVSSPTPATTTSPTTIPGRHSPYPSPNGNITFPPAPPSAPSHPHPIPLPPPLSSSPSSMAQRAAANALNRALSIAKKNLFGHGHSSSNSSRQPSQSHSRGDSGGNMNGVSNGNGNSPSNNTFNGAAGVIPSVPDTTSAPPSPSRRPQLIAVDPIGADGETREARDPLEEELLASLEELAQKTDVLTHWADEMYEYVKAVPQKPLPDPSKFEKQPIETDKQARKRKNADMEAEYNAVTCVAVYMLLMSFSQKGIDKLRNFQEHVRMRFPEGGFVVSEGFDEALNWFKDHYFKCYDRAALVKTWLPVTYDGPKSWLDQLVYDRALLLSRTAARKELLDQMTTPDECEKLYEESLWCLYALQDDLLQTGNPFMDEDRETIATWIKRTKLRLVRCRARMAMNHRDRVNDARADQNLADVARIPAPWDVRPSKLKSKSSSPASGAHVQLP